MTKISPQGYVYGDDPKADNPFWEEEKKDAVIQPITVKSTNSEQTIQATEGIDGYAPITVQPVKLVYKSGVEPSVDGVNLTPSAGNDGFSRVQINPIRSYMVPNLYPENVKSGVKILDTVGTYSGGGSGSSNKPFTVVMIYNDSFMNMVYQNEPSAWREGNHLGDYNVYPISSGTEDEQEKIYSSENIDFDPHVVEGIKIYIQKGDGAAKTVSTPGMIDITLTVSQLEQPGVYETKYYNNDNELVDMTIILCMLDNVLVNIMEDAMIIFAGNT